MGCLAKGLRFYCKETMNGTLLIEQTFQTVGTETFFFWLKRETYEE